MSLLLFVVISSIISIVNYDFPSYLLIAAAYHDHDHHQPAAAPYEPASTSRITILGSVYCDVCHHNTFSKHSYFLSGVDVHVECKFKARSSRTAEQISFSVNRTTDRYGMYKLDIPSVDGVEYCTTEDYKYPTVIQSLCQATLMNTTGTNSSVVGVSSTSCNVPSARSTASTKITLLLKSKNKKNNVCSYTLGALSYKPHVRNFSLCGGNERSMDLEATNYSSSWNSSKFFLPYIPPFQFPWPSYQFPPLPPFPSFPFFPPRITNPPSLPFPFPPLPPWISITTTPPPPPAPTFDIGDPRTWIPNINPLLSPPPPPPPPSPPAFNFWDPRTWIPNLPPTPTNQQNP